MRGAWIIAAALVVGTAAGTARGGVYNTAEPWPQPRPFPQFQQELAAYRAAAAIKEPPEGSLGAHYRSRVKELEADEARGMLTLDGRINLGAYYIRLGEYPKAIATLEKAQGSRNFMLRANLATAYELAGIPDRALLYRQLALSSWPTAYPGWDRVQVNFYRKAEQLHLTLLQLRQEAARQRPNQSGLKLDKLFPRVQFVGPHGAYEAGTISPAQWCEIPYDAGNLVMQLLLWMPFDDGLHWMLGELLNANGDVAAAAAMMKPVVNKQGQDPKKWEAGAPPELREHYRIVAEAAEARQKANAAVLAEGDSYFNLKLLCVLSPRGMGLGAGDLVGEASWPAIVKATESQQPPSPKTDAQATPPSPPPTGWLPDWRTLAVGFAAGAVVAWLLGYQVRQARKVKV
jgi:tetratricopeptide (TPR) repeat protein